MIRQRMESFVLHQPLAMLTTSPSTIVSVWGFLTLRVGMVTPIAGFVSREMGPDTSIHGDKARDCAERGVIPIWLGLDHD